MTTAGFLNQQDSAHRTQFKTMSTTQSLLSLFLTFAVIACTPVSGSQTPDEPKTDTTGSLKLKPIDRSAVSPASPTTDTKAASQAANSTSTETKTKFVWPSETEAETAVHASTDSLDVSRPLIQAFIQKMVDEHDFDANEVTTLLSKAENKVSILEAMSRPAEKSKEWFEYRPIFLNTKRIAGGQLFMQTHQASLQAAETQYGVPAEVITAIIGVETLYGKISGSHKVIDALVTLGFNYPPRAKFFRKELEEFLLLCREQGFDPGVVLGSYAGAMGNGQFISSSYRHYAVDGDGDGVADLWNSWPDAIHSVANYFKQHKWNSSEAVIASAKLSPALQKKHTETKLSLKAQTIGSLKQQGIKFKTTLAKNQPAMLVVMQEEKGPVYFVGFSNFYSITRYNRSPMYALAVHQLSQELLKAPSAENADTAAEK